MVGVVVVAAYSATLVSFLTVAEQDLPFESLADLKKQGTYRLGILKGSVLEEFFQVGLVHISPLLAVIPVHFLNNYREPGGSVVQCLTRDIKVASSIMPHGTFLVKG